MYDELLKQYAKLLGVSITLEELIDSHQFLREKNKQTNKEINEIVERIVADRLKMILTEQYIHIDKLKQMTISDICEIYCPED
jgi:hypothetical protein